MREQDLAELKADICPLRDQQRVVTGTGIGIGGKERAHLGGGLQIVVVAFEAEPARIAAQGPGLDAEQDVVGVVF